MTYQKPSIVSENGLYKKKCESYSEAIQLQNDKKSIYYLGIIEWD